MPPAMALAPLAPMPRAATISRVKFETEVVTRLEDSGDAMTYVVELLAFVKLLFAEVAKEVVVLPDNISITELEVLEELHGEEEGRGAFSSFSTSLCSLEVSDVGVGAMEEGREDALVVVGGPVTLGKEEKGKESWEWLEEACWWEPGAEGKGVRSKPKAGWL